MAVRPLPDSNDESGQPTPLSAALDRVLAGFGAPPAPILTTIADNWVDIVGPVAAANCRPVGVQRGCLRVATSEPAWASQLRWQQAAILAKVEALVGAGSIVSVEVRIASR